MRRAPSPAIDEVDGYRELKSLNELSAGRFGALTEAGLDPQRVRSVLPVVTESFVEGIGNGLVALCAISIAGALLVILAAARSNAGIELPGVRAASADESV